MKTMKKDTPLTALEEPILIAKLQKIPRKYGPPTRRLGSAAEKINPCKPTRKLLDLAQIVNVINVTD
ncbi:unnamed protein product [Prunus armeniaca]